MDQGDYVRCRRSRPTPPIPSQVGVGFRQLHPKASQIGVGFLSPPYPCPLCTPNFTQGHPMPPKAERIGRGSHALSDFANLLLEAFSAILDVSFWLKA